MSRDSLFDGAVTWSGRPAVLTVPPLCKWAAIVFGVVAFTTTLSAVAVATLLRAPVGELVSFAAWLAIMAVGLWRVPLWWRSELEYTITDRSIVVRRGRYRRFIDRRSISFARIHWDPTRPDVGDLELVRAVPTGALMRRMTIVLHGLTAPDRVWAFVRGVTPAAPAGDGQRLLAQRLDEGERVIWSAYPAKHWSRMLPKTTRGILSTLLGLFLVVAALSAGADAVRGVGTVLGTGLSPSSVSFVALIAAVTLSVALLGASAAFVVYASVVRPARLERATRYLITDRRVLIQRGPEELHLERDRIVDVIDAPVLGGKRDLFLVLDGPRARGLALSGGFGEESGNGLQPVLEFVEDSEAVQKLLKPTDVHLAA
jgi:hypothetical protein